jgi:hypothetical protein
MFDHALLTTARLGIMLKVDSRRRRARFIYTRRSIWRNHRSHLALGSSFLSFVTSLVLPAEFMVALAYLAASADPQSVSPEILALETSFAN